MVTPPHIQPLLAAALRAFLWLVSNLGSIACKAFKRRPRDWHTAAASEALSPTSTDQPEGTFSGPRADAPHPAADAQAHKPLHTPVIPGEGAKAPQTRNPGAVRSAIKPGSWVPNDKADARLVSA
jgi:hypothetical protein